MHGPRLRRERPAVEVDGVDRATGAEDVGERERERSGARAELEPGPAGCDRVADQPDVVSVVYEISERSRLRA